MAYRTSISPHIDICSWGALCPCLYSSWLVCRRGPVGASSYIHNFGIGNGASYCEENALCLCSGGSAGGDGYSCRVMCWLLLSENSQLLRSGNASFFFNMGKRVGDGYS